MRRQLSIRCFLVVAVFIATQISCSNGGGGSDPDPPSDPDTDPELPPVLDDPVGAKSTPEPNQPFSKFQLADSLYTGNVYDGRALLAGDNNQLFYSDGVQDFVRWTVPVSQALPDNQDSCNTPQGNGPISLQYRMTAGKDAVDRFFYVRAFPAMVLGTMGGRFESWGVECGNATELTGNNDRDGNSPVFDMAPVNAATGFPVIASNFPDPVKISIKADINTAEATNGIANIFLDSYWHDVSAVSRLPAQNNAWLNTINGINADVTEVWNLNIWFDWPDIDGRQIDSWTGGKFLDTVQITDNPQFDVYVKAEGPRVNNIPTCTLGGDRNCFIYIALALTDKSRTADGVTINYTEIANWMRSEAFRNLFLEGADLIGTGEPKGIAYEIWQTIDGPQNDSHPDPAKRGPRFPDEAHVIGGLHLGSELWFNPTGEPAEIQFDTLGVSVDGTGVFGRYVDYSQ